MAVVECQDNLDLSYSEVECDTESMFDIEDYMLSMRTVSTYFDPLEYNKSKTLELLYDEEYR